MLITLTTIIKSLKVMIMNLNILAEDLIAF